MQSAHTHKITAVTAKAKHLLQQCHAVGIVEEGIVALPLLDNPSP
jgi:hypothetical protein